MTAEQTERENQNDIKPAARPCHGGMGAFGMTGAELKAWRKRLGLTQALAGAAIGMSKDWVKSVEAGRRQAGRVHALACAQYESIAPDEQRPKLTGLWLVKGLIPRTGIGAIYGPSGSGKSFVAIWLAMAISCGVPWYKRRTEQAAVFYMCPDGGDMVQNRIEAYKIRYGAAADHKVFLAPDGINLLAPDAAEKVIETIRRHEIYFGVRFGVVVVDTASRAMPGGDENASKDVTRFIHSLARIGTDGRVVFFVHHTPKTDGKVLRGHSALHGACDFELNVCERVITVAKQRDGDAGQRLGFGLETVEIGRDEDGEPVTSCVAVTADAPDARSRRTRAQYESIALPETQVCDEWGKRP